uniref:Uncharacterized protein n=1 Tax=Romanomermis culicivorax TaxID=13658 RepID=A0A915KUG9_ROMCU
MQIFDTIGKKVELKTSFSHLTCNDIRTGPLFTPQSHSLTVKAGVGPGVGGPLLICDTYFESELNCLLFNIIGTTFRLLVE